MNYILHHKDKNNIRKGKIFYKKIISLLSRRQLQKLVIKFEGRIRIIDFM